MKKKKSLAELIESHPEYLKLKKWRYASISEILRNKKAKYSRKAYNHLTKSIKRLKQLKKEK